MPSQGGCERDLTRVATNIDRSRFTPHVGCFYREGVRLADLTDAGIPVIEFPLRSLKSLISSYSMIQTFRSYVRQHRIQLIHTFDVPTTLALLPLARMARIPVLIESQLSLRGFYRRPEQTFLGFADKMARRIVVNSQAVLEDLVSNHGVPRTKLVLVYNGVDTSMFYPAEKFRPAGVEDAPVVIGTIAVLRPEKQLHLLIEAFSRVRHLRPGVKLLMVGSGDEEARLRRLAEELRVSEDVLWVPNQSDVAKWMRAIDIFVLSSLSESFPNGLLEAMASGCCPVGSNVGGVPELIENEKSGLLFPSGDVEALTGRLALLLGNDSLRAEFGRRAAERAATQFHLERFVAGTAGLYETLLSQHYGITCSPVTAHF
jgi:glycosyltransferase involved in cell wall biosynthesis